MKHLCTGGDSNGPVLQSHQHAHVEVKGGYDIGFSVSVPGGGAGSISFSVVTAYAGSDSGSHRW